MANAVRHTPQGGRIRLHAAPDAADGGRIAITVDDSGPGLPAEHAGRVFDRFYRVDSSRDARSGGSGLGLSIVRQIAETHGGGVTVEPLPRGVRLRLHLPPVSLTMEPIRVAAPPREPAPAVLDHPRMPGTPRI